jgi:hypothetical protein
LRRQIADNRQRVVNYTIHSKIAGVSFNNDDGSSRQQIIRKFCKEGDQLTLKREPNNPYGRGNAIAVHLPTGPQLGYIEHGLSRDLAPKIDVGTRLRVTVAAVTGIDKSALGVDIAIEVVMSQYRIAGADKKTGADKVIPVIAESPKEAEKQAWKQGMYISEVTDMGPAQT